MPIKLAQSAAGCSLFSKLPTEVRLQIYEHALYTPDEQGFVVVTKEHGIPEPSLLLTCKAIRNEALGIFYLHNWFLCVMTDHHPATEVLITRKTKVWGDDSVDWRQYSDGCRWNNLLLWCRHYQAGDAHAQAKMAVKKHEDDDVGDQSVEYMIQHRFIDSLFSVAEAMRGRSWEDTEHVLEGLRPGLVALNWDWRRD